MDIIYKYPLVIGRQKILTRMKCRPLSAQMQGEQLVMWAMVDTNSPEQDMVVLVAPTGKNLDDYQVPDDDARVLGYVGTAQAFDGTVWHVFAEEAVERIMRGQMAEAAKQAIATEGSC